MHAAVRARDGLNTTSEFVTLPIIVNRYFAEDLDEVEQLLNNTI